jgi:hypothetical protein
MNGFFDMRHQYETKFYGCKHILLEEYMIIWDELIPRKFDRLKSLSWDRCYDF